MISACIITKNECENLDICLERLSHYPIEIVVIDTGSTDDTKKVASKYTNNIFDFEWCNDFSAARNFAISKATKEYILMIDTDEFVDTFDYNKTIQLIDKYPSSIGNIHRKNPYQSNDSEMVSNELIHRLFPRKYYHYTGTIHEQVTVLDESISHESVYDAPIHITHVGYNGGKELRKTKALRNLSLLFKELESSPNDAYILYQIGKSYFFIQDYSNAIIYFDKSMDQAISPRLNYVRSMISTYGYCFIYTNQYSNALMLEAVYDDFCDSADYLFVLGLIYMYNARFEDAVNSFLLATTIPKCEVVGVNSYLAYHNIGVILECLNDKANAINYYKKCGDHKPALEGIKRCSI